MGRSAGRSCRPASSSRPETVSRVGTGSECVAFGGPCEGHAAAGKAGAAKAARLPKVLHASKLLVWRGKPPFTRGGCPYAALRGSFTSLQFSETRKDRGPGAVRGRR